MASSSIITSINSALDDLDFLLLDPDFAYWVKVALKGQRYRLRNLKTFVLCARKLGNDVHQRSNASTCFAFWTSFFYRTSVLRARKLGNDGSWGSLLIRIDDAVGSFALETHSCRKFAGIDEDAVRRCDSCFKTDIQPLMKDIDIWYITMLDYGRQSSSLTVNKIVNVIESISENLVDFPFPRLSEPMEALREHVKFLINFCRFVTKSGVKHGQIEDLLTHIKDVAINAAHLCFLCGANNGDEEWRKEMQFKVSILLQKIKPFNETYYEALSCLKWPPTQDIMTDFIDSLISILWYTLRQDTDHVFSLKDRGQVLYEELRSLRTTLKKLPNNIDEETRDVIPAVACDAEVLICSFYRIKVEIALGLKDLLKRKKPFLANVEERVPQTSIFNFPRINEMDFVDFLLENLMEQTNDKVELVVKSHVQTIKEELLYLRSFLEETVNSRALWNRVLETLYRLEFLIDHLVVGDISNSFSMEFDSIMEDLRNIKADDALKNFYGKREGIKVKEATSTSNHVPSQKIDSITTEVVGFGLEAELIMGRLIRGSKQLKVITIVGMGGCGKTTLATKVYNDPSVVHHFHVRAWRHVSQTWDKKALLLELLNQIDPGNYSEMTEDDLAEKLWRRLRGMRYLIFLDDIWTIEAWNSLKSSFPDDSKGSRIILTSRNLGTAPLDMLDQEPLLLRELDKDESLELLQRKLFQGKVWPPALCDLGMQIAEKCKGLPLTIVIVAGLLAGIQQEGWKEIVDGLSSGIVSNTEQCMELSYQHLPDYLKPCLLYFGAFPEDQVVSMRRLIRLWIAEGFVQKSKSKSLEDVAEDYMKDLIGRSLIMVAQQRSIGGVKSCRIHDLLHDFCLKKAKDEYFFHLLKGHDELLAFNEPCNLRRLCIHSKPEHFKKSKLFCPRARSLRFFAQEIKGPIDILFVIHIFKLVRVLDLMEINLGDEFPSEIELLVQLRYLSIRGFIGCIPSSVGNLSMLETLIVDPCRRNVTLPDTIWNLRKLKYIFICSGSDGVGGGSFTIKNLDNSVLYELDRISGAIFVGMGSMEKQMNMCPNIHKLKCKLFKDPADAEELQHIVRLDFLSRLESLHLTLSNQDPHEMYREPSKHCYVDFCLPKNLKKLTLTNFWLPRSNISAIGKLSNLEVLKLLNGAFRRETLKEETREMEEGEFPKPNQEVLKSLFPAPFRRETLKEETWEMEEGEFAKLRYLKLTMDIVTWIASDDQFPCLQKLVLEKCWSLKKVPSCLESTPTLEMIEVSDCSNITTSLVKHIEEQQESLGNSALKVIIHSSIF